MGQRSIGKADRNAEICKLVEAGMTLAEAGRKYGISRKRVSQICAACGVRPRNRMHYTEAERAAVIDGLKRGQLLAHVAPRGRYLNARTSWIMAVRPVQPAGTAWSAHEDSVLRAEYGDRGSAARIATRLGRTRNEVIGRANRLGLGKSIRRAA